MNIVYIHGNAATPDCFNFIRTHLTGHHEILIRYDSRDGFYSNYNKMLERLRDVQDIFFIAHSLGGVYAVHLANELTDNVLGAVTMSTPYGGSKEARFAKYLMPFNQVLKDIQPHSAPIVSANLMKIRHPWTAIVSTRGHSALMAVPNDGVVTQDSMRRRKDVRYVDVASGHFEIVQTYEALAIIKEAVQETGRQKAYAPIDLRSRVVEADRVVGAFRRLFSTVWKRS